MDEIKCGEGGIKSMVIYQAIDLHPLTLKCGVITDIKVKRKYGKFKRPVFKIDLEENK